MYRGLRASQEDYSSSDRQDPIVQISLRCALIGQRALDLKCDSKLRLILLIDTIGTSVGDYQRGLVRHCGVGFIRLSYRHLEAR